MIDERAHRRIGTEVVDGLRGFAILWVVAFHVAIFAGPAPAWAASFAATGYLGVEAFFVLSGFCLFSQLRLSGLAKMRAALERKAA